MPLSTWMQGPPGEKGDKGDTGERGIQGETGIQGPQGEQGPQGPQGIQGEAGPQGIQGVAGQDGAVDASAAWPVGSIFISAVSTNPSTLLGFGTWSAIGAGRVLVGQDTNDTDFDTLGETGGAKTHTLTIAEMPSHTHVQTNNSATTGGLVGYAARDTSTNNQTATGYSTEATGGGGAHNNLQPYLVVAFWQRTA
jgi:hypothetical protein